MKYLTFLSATLIFLSCNENHFSKESAYKYISTDTVNVLHTGDSAMIIVSYPQGTAWHQYDFKETQGALRLSGHTTHDGDPDENGGSMSEVFFMKAVKEGVDTVFITDVSPSALKAAADTTRTFINYKKYIIKVFS